MVPKFFVWSYCFWKSKKKTLCWCACVMIFLRFFLCYLFFPFIFQTCAMVIVSFLYPYFLNAIVHKRLLTLQSKIFSSNCCEVHSISFMLVRKELFSFWCVCVFNSFVLLRNEVFLQLETNDIVVKWKSYIFDYKFKSLTDTSNATKKKLLL